MAQANDWAIGDTGQSTSASEVWWWKPSRVRMSRIARQLDFRNYWGDPPPLTRQCFETAHGTKHTFSWLTSGDRSDQATLPCLHVPQRRQSSILSLSGQTAIAHAACHRLKSKVPLDKASKSRVHAINVLEYPRHLSLLPWKPLRPPARPMREQSAMRQTPPKVRY